MSVNEYIFRDSHIGVRIVVTPANHAFAGQNDCVIMYKNVSTARENSLHLKGHTTFSSPLMDNSRRGASGGGCDGDDETSQTKPLHD